MVNTLHEDSGNSEREGNSYHHEPYRLLDVLSNGLSLRPVDHPGEAPILVNQDRVTKCSLELLRGMDIGPRKGC